MTDLRDTVHEVEPTTKYRKVPLVLDENARVIQCARRRGHVLTVHGGEIRCAECPAIWKDYGH